jgi:hypothetical protein
MGQDEIVADPAHAVIRDMFGEFGEIHSVSVRKKPGTNNSWAFVVFKKKEQAALAIRRRKVLVPSGRLQSKSIGAVELTVNPLKDDKLHEDKGIANKMHQQWQKGVTGGQVIGTIQTDVNGLFVARRGGDVGKDLKRTGSMMFDPLLLKRAATSFRDGNGLNIRDRRKQGQTYAQCFIAAEGVEWLGQWLLDNRCDNSVSASERLFTELLNAGLFEVLEQDDISRKPKAHRESFADAFVFCRFVQGGGGSIFNCDIEPGLVDTSPVSVRRPKELSMAWLSTGSAVAAAIRLQSAFRAKRAQRLAQRYQKVMTRKLTIHAPSTASGVQGEALGELIVRCVWKQTDPEQLVMLEEGQGFEERPDGLQLLQDNGASKQVEWHRKYYQADPNYLLNDTVQTKTLFLWNGFFESFPCVCPEPVLVN